VALRATNTLLDTNKFLASDLSRGHNPKET
jgi:hypothetical protein